MPGNAQISRAVIPPGAMRLVLALTVVVWHYAVLSGHKPPIPLDGVAVASFFFLSGYWITHLWRSRYEKTDNPVLVFYVSRIWRIYPIATITTLAMALLVGADLARLSSNLVLITQRLGSAINPPAWSLAVELQFYALAPFLLRSRHLRVWLIATGVIGCIGWSRFALGLTGTHMPAFLLPFVLGVAFARNQEAQQLAVRGAPYSVATLAVAIIVLSFADLSSDPAQRFAVIALSLIALPAVAASLSVRSSADDRRLGELAYPVYLGHWPAYVVASMVLPISPMQIAVAMLLTVGATYALRVFVDVPLERRRQQWVSERARGQTGDESVSIAALTSAR